MGLNAAETALRLYLLKFYTDGQGLAPGLAGVAFALGLLWDALLDPLMGAFSDRTAHRFGGRRSWILVGAALLATGLLAVFVPPTLTSQAAMFAWLVFAGCLLNTGLTVVYVPYLATCNEMTDIPHERSVLFGWRFAAANVGAVIAVALPITLVGTTTGTVGAMPITSAIIAALVLVGAGVTWTVTRPRNTRVRVPDPTPVLRGLLDAARNRTFLPLLLAYVIASAGVGVNATTALYYYGYCLRLSDVQVQSLIAVFLVAFTAASAGGCKASTFEVGPGELEPPSKASAVALTTGGELTWSAVPDAAEYRLYFSTDPMAVDEGIAEPNVVSGTRYEWRGLEAGRRHYVTLQSVAAGGEELSELSELLSVEPLRALPGVPPRGLQVDAGMVQVVLVGQSEGLKLAAWSDPGGGFPEDQVCVVAWNNERSNDYVMDPCTTPLQDGAEWKDPGRYQPILYVEDGSGRIGEAFTTVYVR